MLALLSMCSYTNLWVLQQDAEDVPVVVPVQRNLVALSHGICTAQHTNTSSSEHQRHGKKKKAPKGFTQHLSTSKQTASALF